MKKITLIFIYLLFVFCSCSNVSSLYKDFETKNYFISNSHIEANEYKKIDGRIENVPFLPSGLYLVCEKDKIPKLDYQKRREDVGEYPIYDVLYVYQSEDFIFVKSKKNNFKINIDEPYKMTILDDFSMEGKELIFNYELVNNKNDTKFIQNAFSIQDKRINRKYNVNFSTPIINGITKIGLYEDKFYFGETLYSYFILDLVRDEVTYFKNKFEYESFLNKNIEHSVKVLESVFLYE